jgi:hypothetical protein
MAQIRTIDDVLSAYRDENRRRKEKEYCYFIQRHSDMCIKIGYSGDVRDRSLHISKEVKSPVTILGVVKGGCSFERLLHRMFNHLRIEGEWFKNEPILMQYIIENSQPMDAIKEHRKREYKPRQPRVDWKARRIAVLTGRLQSQKDFVRRRAITTLGIEFKEEAFPILREHQAKDISPRVREWVDIIIDMVEKNVVQVAA